MVALVAALLFPLVVRDPYFRHLGILVLIWVTLGTSWNIISGYTGQVSFGHAAFFGIGAYSAGLLEAKLEISVWWGMALGGPAAVLLALPFGWICFRLRGAYFALGTLALGEIMRHVATIWESLTDGMIGLLVMQTFISKVPYYYIALAIAVLSVLTTKGITRSRFGSFFVAIREDQDAAASFGINAQRTKMVSLSISAFLAGLAGALYMIYMGFIDPEVVFSLHDISIMAILVGIVGGVSTVYGPAVGALIMVGLQELFRTAGFGLLGSLAQDSGSPAIEKAVELIRQAHVLTFGVLVVLVILFLPNGVVGDWSRIRAVPGRVWALAIRRSGTGSAGDQKP